MLTWKMQKLLDLRSRCGRRTARWAALLTLGVTAVACAGPGSPAAPTGSTNATASSATVDLSAELAFCADEVNRYRASIGRPALSRSGPLEAFAAAAAESDSRARVAHHHFTLTSGGGVSQAETEILWWRGHAVRNVIKDGLAQMWKAGPNGHHYEILSGDFREVGCGVFVHNGEVTVAQDFR